MTSVSFNGTSYAVPATGEEDWGGSTKVDGLLIALATDSFQRSGGNFTLTADVDFGASAGLKAAYYKSRATVATTGILRLGNAETVAWMNAAGSANYTLQVNSSNAFIFKADSTTIFTIGSTGIITPAAAINLFAGTVSVPGLGWADDVDGTGSGWYRIGANNIGMTLNGVKAADYAFGAYTYTRTTAGSNCVLASYHSDNTSGSSHAIVKALVGGTSGGDPIFQADINGSTIWSWGADNSDSDSWCLVAASTLTGTNFIKCTTGGLVTLGATSGTNSHVVNGRLQVNYADTASYGYIGITASDNTTATTHAAFNAIVGGASGGDPYLYLAVTGAAERSIGIDNSDSDKFKITTGGTGPSSGTTHFQLDTLGNAFFGSAALATNATDGFLRVSTSAGTPTGAPTAMTGSAALHVDTTNNLLYFYSSAAWRATVTSTSALASYRRPVLQYVSATLVDVENNTATANQTTIVFPDGTSRSVTEDTGVTTKYRRFDITATAEFTSGTEDSGVRSGISEATNTWYAIYAVKSAIDAAKFVLVGDTTFPTQANASTLDGRYGASSWVHLGYIRNGDASGATGDILAFTQVGNFTMFRNVTTGAVINGVGVRLATASGAATVTYTYAAGSGAAQIPNTIGISMFGLSCTAATGQVIAADSGGTIKFSQQHDGGAASLRAWIAPALLGVQGSTGPAANEDWDVYLYGFYDTVLGVGGNPLL